MTPETDPLPAFGDRIPLVHGLELRLLDPEDFPRERDHELVELLRRAFNGGPAWFSFDVEPIDHLRWKFRDFPGISLLEVTEDRDTVVGLRVHHHHRYHSQGEEVMVGEEVDVGLEPSYQGRGVNSAQLAMGRRLMPLTPWYAYKIALDAHPFADRRMGKPSDDELMGNPLLTLVKLISPLRLLRSQLSRRLARGDGGDDDAGSGTRRVLEARGFGNRVSRGAQAVAALGLARATLRASLGRRPAPGAWTIQPTTQFDERADRFWERARDQFDVIQIRDREYLNWRFCDPRAGRFIVRSAEAGDELLGYVVLRVDAPSAVIADVLTLPGRTDVLRSLLDDAVAVARAEGAHHLRCWGIERHPYLDELRRAGFASYPHAMFFRYAHATRTMPELTFLSDRETRVHFQPSDTDHA